MKVIPVNQNNFDKEVLKEDRVLVDFNAEWCGPCKMLGPILEEVAKKEEHTKIVSINVDENEELASEYSVFSIPCLVLFEKGKETKRNVGFLPKNELEKFIEE